MVYIPPYGKKVTTEDIAVASGGRVKINYNGLVTLVLLTNTSPVYVGFLEYIDPATGPQYSPEYQLQFLQPTTVLITEDKYIINNSTSGIVVRVYKR